MKKIYFYFLSFCLSIAVLSVSAQTTTTYSSAGTYTFSVPAGCNFVAIDLSGAQGGDGCNYATYAGGKGGRVQCTLAVTPGQQLYVVVGGQGGYFLAGSPGGGGYPGNYGGGGGGYSAVKNTSSSLSSSNALVVGGGGGGGDCYYGDAGGAGGTLTGQNGKWGCGGTCGSYNSYNCGAGGNTTTSTGGAGGSGGGASGGFGFGGNAYCCYYGGAGGGGYYGGGGGYNGSGGGGSSYTSATYATSVTHTQGFRSGSGIVNITPLVPTVTVAPTSLTFTPVTSSTTSIPPMYFAMTGSTLNAGGSLTIAAPSNFAVSLDGITWSSTSVAYTYTGNAFSNINVYVRFNAPASAGSYSGNVVITGGGLPSAVNVAVSGTSAAICSGTPTPGSAVISSSLGGSSNLFTLSLTGASTTGGLYYQWQSSPNNSTWTDINGAITPIYSFVGISSSTYFRCVVTCSASGSSANSASVLATFASSTVVASSCTPAFTNGCTTGTPMYASINTLLGIGGTSLSDPATDCGGAAYLDKTALPTATLNVGSTNTAALNLSTSYSYYFNVQIWIDFSNDGVFQTSETVGGVSYPNSAGANINTTITIPAGAAPGTHRMRIMSNYAGCCGNTLYPNMNPCPTSGTHGYGQVRDYKILIGVPAPLPACSGTQMAGITSSTPTSNCTTFNPRLFTTGHAIPFTGLTYQWQSSTTGPSSGFSNISGATGQGYVATISSVGTVYYRQNVTCGAATATTIVTSDTFNTPPATSGPNNVCVGANITLTNTVSGGIWTSSSPSQASVGSTTGIVTGNIGGTTPTIIYTTPTGCIATYTITVNTQPAAIGGTLVVCPVATTGLTDASSGGIWSSSSTATATVGSTTGVVTGVAGGTATISYTLPTGCSSLATLTVQALAPITGTPTMCNGFSTSLADATSGGVWTSSNTAVGTVSSTGVVTSISVGSTSISYTVASLGCSAVVTAFVTNAPLSFTVTGGGALCSGATTGVTVGVGSSNLGISYQLYNGATAVGTAITGAGFPFTFPAQFAAGTYGVVAAAGTPCALTGTGTVNIVVNPLPTPYTVSGGGAYCAGGSGVHVYLNASQINVNYQLFVNTGSGPSPVGGVIPGTSAALDFGFVTTPGSYTVGALNTITGCAGNMANSVTVTTNPVPSNAFALTGGGGYCTGSSAPSIGLSGSVVGINYQLLLGGVPVAGALVAGTGSPISFGPQGIPGTYTVLATNTTTGCTAIIASSMAVVINPLPTVYTMTGGGNYCSGTTVGVPIGLNGSQTGVNYQLYRGATLVGTAVAGTGSAISFPNQFTAGSYTVVATNQTTLCSINMFGSSNVIINPLPTAFTIIAPSGSSYCAGSTGVRLGLSSSEVGVNYQLLNGTAVAGAAIGTGSALDFGLYTIAGTYTVVGTNTITGCVGTMGGVINLVVNALPTAYNVTVTAGGVYCAGSTGPTVGLTGSQSGVSYQLYQGGVAVSGATVSGTGAAINFGARTAGAYTVVATNTSTLCTNNMTGSAAIIANPTPTIYTVTGGGGYCSGSAGSPIGLSGSDLGINYQLYNIATPSGPAVPGTGSAVSFGSITTTGTNYNVIATNSITNCSSNMSGILTVTVNAVPTAYPLSGGGNYCLGGSGMPIGLTNSATGVNYQLYRGITPVGSPVAGTTGSSVTFGSQTVVGTYTVVAMNTTTGCTNNMTGTATIGVNPLPSIFTVTGGGNYCSGGAGVNVSLNGSVIGTDYQLYLGGATIGAPMAGTGGILSFGLQTAAGTYTVMATTTATTCTNNMAGSVTISISTLPAAYVITGGGNYCTGGAGLHVGLSSSATGVLYQLQIGGSPIGAPMPGTGLALDFGSQTSGGTYTILGTNTSTGCSVLMTGVATVVVNSLPTPYNVTGGGNYCPGTTGVTVGLSGSNIANTYQLYRGATAVGGSVTGTGAALSFGLQTVAGTYTVVANNPSTTCSGSMTGSVNVGTYALPVIYNVTGGGNFCPGGSGSHVGVSSSSLGVDYQLYVGGVMTGMPIAGTGSAIDFGLQTSTGTYTVKGTNATTGCTISMSGTAVIAVASLPTAHTVTGGGNYCTGGIGVHIGLASSTAGVYYQLYNGMTAMGSPMAGTGASLDFGLQTIGGTYTINGTSTSTTCTNTMSGSVVINIDPLPTAYTVTGGGNFCTGGSGVNVMLSNSDIGTDYQLYNGAMPVGSPMPGTGTALDFGLQTAAGNYSVVATNTTTMCNNNMTGAATITINPLPTAYNVTGGGNYCTGGIGVHVMLSGSDVGSQYQLMLAGSPVGAPMAGTGFGLDFGWQTVPGAYTVSATNTYTTCAGDMTGSVNVGINPLPTVYTITGMGSSYCSGGAGINLSLSGSDMGTNYQLYVGATAVGTAMPGTGLPLNFGYRTATGNYTVVAVNATTGCTNNMSGAASITINPLPVAFTVTGGGSYCNGGTGVNIGLSSSNIGVSYQLYNSGIPVGGSMTGTGAALSFGLQTAAGNYTIMATNATTSCTNTMAGSATVIANPLPASYTVTGGGNYCNGGTGVHVGLSGSALGITYQLWKGSSMVGSSMPGTGLPLDFGMQTGTGTYTVSATNTTTSCNRNMTGSATVGINPLPTPYTVMGGGNYCPGGVGVHVTMGNTNTGISYQLYNGTAMVGAAMSGTGSGIDFGAQTAAGTYTVKATNTATGCSNTMSGSVNVVINTLPAVYSVVGGGNYCAGGSGAHIGLNNSAVGISYQAYNLATATGAPVIGTGGPLDLGAETAAGTYTVIGTDLSTTCSSSMSGSATVSISTVVSPAVTISTGVGDTVCTGSMTTFTAMAVNGGTAPSYQWTVNGSPAGIGSAYSYLPANGDVVGVTLTSSAACAMPSTASNTIAMTVETSQLPVVTVTPNPGSNVCQGTLVTYTAAPSYGGSAPTYSWIINGINSGSSPMYSFTPANGDVVYCVMNSNYHCRIANSAASSHITMQVDAPVLPVVTITANPGNNVSAGQPVILTASSVNAGSSPAYQWFLNGTAVTGANTATYASNNFANGDSISCEVTSNGGCAGLTGFNAITIHVSGVGVTNVVATNSDIKLVPNPNKGTFTIKGTLGTTADEQVSIEVTNLLGQMIYTGKVIAQNGVLNEKIELSKTLANGMYMLNLRTENENKVFHIVIEQ